MTSVYVADACALTADERLLYEFAVRLKYDGAPPDPPEQGLGLIRDVTVGPPLYVGEIAALVSDGAKTQGITWSRQSGLAENFVQANRDRCTLPYSLSIGVQTTLFTDKAVSSLGDDLDSDTWWSAFAKKYPGESEYRSLSRVGFSDDQTMAAVYTSVHCGSQCARGELYIFQRIGKGWRIVANHRVAPARASN